MVTVLSEAPQYSRAMDGGDVGVKEFVQHGPARFTQRQADEVHSSEWFRVHVSRRCTPLRWTGRAVRWDDGRQGGS